MSLRPSSLSPDELLGTHVLRRAHHQAGLRHLLARLAARRLGDAEVHDLHAVRRRRGLRDHDVVGLEIAVHDAQVVRRLERVGGLPDDLGGARRRQRALAAR